MSAKARSSRIVRAAAVAAVAVSTRALATDVHFDYIPSIVQSQIDVLNYASINGNYMMSSGDVHRPEMLAHNNNLAEFYNFLQDRYDAHTTKDGNVSADEIDDYVVSNSTNNGPKPTWLILNEISTSLWQVNPGAPSLSTYRNWLVDCVTRLHDHYGYDVVTYSPFPTVGSGSGSNQASWQALAAKSYIGIENYLSGTEVWSHGSDYTSRYNWCVSQYQASKTTYTAAGVSFSKLFLGEFMGNTDSTYIDSGGNVAPVYWGRAGLASASDWDTVLQMRQDAIYSIGFPGFLAYSWGSNGMGVTLDEQLQHEYFYRTRLVVPGQQPQWLSDDAYTVNGISVSLSWNQPLNWCGGVPNAAGAVANFFRTNTAARTITLDGNKTIGALSFDSPDSYTIAPGTGGTLTLNNLGSAVPIAVNQGTHTISVALAGTSGFTKSGSGTLQLTHTANTYSGATIINGGLVAYSTAGSYGSTSSILINSGGAVGLATGSLDSTFLGKITAAPSASTGGLALASADAAANVDFTSAPLSNAKTVGMSVGAIDTVTFTGTITPDPANGYRLGGGGTLVLANTNALTGTRNVAIVNGGTVLLAGSNNYTGTTSINGTTLKISSDAALGTSSNPITITAGTVQLGGNWSTSRTITLNAGGASIDSNGFSATASGIIGGSGSLTKTGNGTLILAAANTYTGATNISAGTLQFQGSGSIASTTDVTVDTAGTLNVNGLTRTIASLSGAGQVSLGTGGSLSAGSNGNSTSYSGIMSGAGSFTKVGTGTLTLVSGNASTYTGSTTISGGTLEVQAENRLGAMPAVVTANAITLGAGTMRLGNGVNISANRGITLASGNGTIDVVSADSATITGPVSGSASPLTKTGDGTLTMTGSTHSYGKLVLKGGTFAVTKDANLGAVPTSVDPTNITFDGGTMQVYSNQSPNFNANRGITINAGGGVIQDDHSSGNFIINGAIHGTGHLIRRGTASNPTHLAGNSDFTGGIEIQAGRVNFNGNNAAGANTNIITLDAGAGAVAEMGIGTTVGPTTVTLQNPIVLAPTDDGISSIETASGTTLTLAGVISGSGGLQKGNFAGATGTVVLSGVNTYSGPTTILLGRMQLGASGVVPNGSAVVANFGTTFDVNGATETVGSIAGVGSFVLGSGTLTAGGDGTSTTVSGIISGTSGNLTKTSAGILTLTGANTYGGLTTVTGGTLAAGAANLGSGGSGNNIVLNGGTLKTTGAISTNRKITLGTSGGTIDSNGFTSSFGDLDPGNFTKNGAGKVSLRSINALHVTVNAGTLAAKDRASTGANQVARMTALVINPSAALDLNDNDLVIDYTGASPFTTIKAYVFNGYSGSPDTTKVGITSTSGQNSGGVTIHALIDNNSPEITPGYPDWPQGSGLTTDSTTVIGKYTYFGDVNLDGQVTGDDYGPIDADLDNAITYSEGASWIFGDTNFDQVVTGDDYGYVDSNIGLGTANPLAPAGVSVPEPGGLMSLSAAVGFAAIRRRVRRGK